MLLWALACAVPNEPATEDSASVASTVSCPPEGPYGLGAGEVAEDVAFTECDGGAVSLHGLCGRPALVVNWYGWCPSCQDNARFAAELADAHSALQVAIVLDEDPLEAPVDAAFCTAYAETFPSAAAAWMDPQKGLERYGTTDLVLVLARDGRLELAEPTVNHAEIEAAVERVLEAGAGG